MHTTTQVVVLQVGRRLHRLAATASDGCNMGYLHAVEPNTCKRRAADRGSGAVGTVPREAGDAALS